MSQAAFVEMSDRAFVQIHSLSLDWRLRTKQGSVPAQRSETQPEQKRSESMENPTNLKAGETVYPTLRLFSFFFFCGGLRFGFFCIPGIHWLLGRFLAVLAWGLWTLQSQTVLVPHQCFACP